MKSYNISKERAIIELLRSEFPEMKGLTEGEVFQMTKITNGDSSYKFGLVGPTDYSKLPELLINDKNLFVCTALRMVLVKQAAAKPMAITPYSYPNKEEFGANYNDLEVFFNGLMTFRVNTDVVFEDLRTSCFRHVPEQIRQAAVASVSAERVHDSYSARQGSKELDAPVVINGNNTNTLEINIRSSAGLSIQGPGSGVEHYVGIQLFGVTLPGAAREHYDRARAALRLLYTK